MHLILLYETPYESEAKRVRRDDNEETIVKNEVLGCSAAHPHVSSKTLFPGPALVDQESQMFTEFGGNRLSYLLAHQVPKPTEKNTFNTRPFFTLAV